MSASPIAQLPDESRATGSATTPDISILMCTYNRADMMKDALESWLKVEHGDWLVEFIVIDNASTDNTRAIVESVTETSGYPFRYVFEERSGLSHARNRGIDEAHGDIVAFVDDDVYFDPQWLTLLLKTFQEQQDFDCVGGNTLPAFEVPRPDWLDDNMIKFYGATLSGDKDKEMRYPEHPFGVNMAFRRRVFSTIGHFNPNLGRVGYSLLSNEESEFFRRVANAQAKVYYASGAILHHRVPAERLEPEWLVRRAYWQGISKVIFDTQVEHVSRMAHIRSLFGAVRNFCSLVSRSITQQSPAAKTPRSRLMKKLRYHQLLGVAKQSLIEAMRPTR